MRAVAATIGRTISYIDVSFDEWQDQELRSRGLPEHLFSHMVTMV